jgi:hypothetical protein
VAVVRGLMAVRARLATAARPNLHWFLQSSQATQESSARPFRPGDWVEVRSLDEISATLDSEGKLKGLPFMPEMVNYCGKRFPVSKRAEKTCFAERQRRFGNAVHLADLRCNGSAHDGCQLGCLLFWRDEWLKPVAGPAPDVPPASTNNGAKSNLLTRRTLPNGETLYVCQATELGKLSTEIKLWDLTQYFTELRAGNLTVTEVKQVLGWFFTWLEWRFFKLTSKKQTTPAFQTEPISPGDLVEVRPKKEILQTLTNRGRNFGLAFSAEMLMLCGKRYRVVNNVNKMIDEHTGKMLSMKRSCLTLDSATCKGAFKCCPRANYHFWRDEWLKKIEGPHR